MFTLGLLYTCIYILVFFSLLTLSFVYLPLYFLTHHSVTSYLIILQKYNIYKNLFLMLIFSLTGLPPVGLFFIKFNILTYILYQTHIILVFLIFLVFFLNMLYYIQLFNFKNFKKPVYNIINNNVFNIWEQNMPYKSYLTSYNHYYLILLVINILGIVILNFFIFTDLFLILSL